MFTFSIFLTYCICLFLILSYISPVLTSVNAANSHSSKRNYISVTTFHKQRLLNAADPSLISYFLFKLKIVSFPCRSVKYLSEVIKRICSTFTDRGQDQLIEEEMSKADFDAVPEVDIDDGVFKYVYIRYV